MILKSLEEYKYMKPHFTKALEPMIEYIASNNDYSNPPNGSESYRSKLSYLQGNTESNLSVYESNFKPAFDKSSAPNKVERMMKYYHAESTDFQMKADMKIKNVNFDYYGLKNRSGSRHNKQTRRLESSKKTRDKAVIQK